MPLMFRVAFLAIIEVKLFFSTFSEFPASSRSLTDSPLPSYRLPPLTEMVIAVQFERLRGFSNAHAGSFWERLGRESWPLVSEVPELPAQFEKFGPGQFLQNRLQLQLTQDPACRTRFRNLQGDRLLQLQRDRLILNWIGSGESYPRFETHLGDFRSLFEEFTDYLGSAEFPEPEINQWEITYQNTIPQGTVWSSPEDWGFFTPLSGVMSLPGIPKQESFNGQWHFVMPEETGRLHIQWQHIRSSDESAEEKIRLTLTARGPAKDTKSFLDGVHVGRETIVRTFRDLMSDNANRFWGLEI